MLDTEIASKNTLGFSGTVVSMNYDQFLACLCIWREARNQSLPAKTGVWHVIQNRTTDAQRRWPRTVSGVVAQHHQFSSMTFAGDPNLVAWPVQPNPGTDGGADWMAFLDCQTVVESPLAADPTNGSNMYESLPEGAKRPAWATDEAFTMQIGAIRFYRI